MKYETPELTVLTPAINAVQTPGNHKNSTLVDQASPISNDSVSGYADWE